MKIMTSEQVHDFVDAILNGKIENLKELIDEGFDINHSYEWPMGCVNLFFSKLKGSKKVFQLNLKYVRNTLYLFSV
jgi:hypothetical protein